MLSTIFTNEIFSIMLDFSLFKLFQLKRYVTESSRAEDRGGCSDRLACSCLDKTRDNP